MLDGTIIGDIAFFKASASGCSGSNCVQVGWRKAETSGNGGNCVQVGPDDDGTSIRVRDSKANGEGPELMFTADEWVAFVTGVKAGEFDYNTVRERALIQA